MSMIGLEAIDMAGREMNQRCNALERMLKLVPTQCGDVVTEGGTFILINGVGIYLSVSRSGSTWNYDVHLSRTNGVAAMVNARTVANALAQELLSVERFAYAIAERIAVAESEQYRSRRERELKKAFREA